MTNGRGERVRLSITDWVAIAGLLLGQMTVLGGIGIAMWTRLAVLEAKVEHQGTDFREMRATLHERWEKMK